MIHFECFTCGMQATIVNTESGKLAWLDHVNRHAVPENYGIWTWMAVQAPDTIKGPATSYG